MTLSTVNVFSKSTREAYHIDLSDCNLKEFNIHWPSFVRISTNRKFYHRFLIQTNAKEPIHASLGDNIILRRVSGILERVENTTGSDPI
ncbi:hypothetical protein K501DRAFT_287529 [Backusella circina FSU 941]|nr:hypothetical protein K501DRAFT_287529 [Backusella circina FSU 941]